VSLSETAKREVEATGVVAAAAEEEMREVEAGEVRLSDEEVEDEARVEEEVDVESASTSEVVGMTTD